MLDQHIDIDDRELDTDDVKSEPEVIKPEANENEYNSSDLEQKDDTLLTLKNFKAKRNKDYLNLTSIDALEEYQEELDEHQNHNSIP